MTYDVRKDRQLVLENEQMISAGRHEIADRFETPGDGSSTALIHRGLQQRPVSPAARAEAMRKIDGAVGMIERLYRNPIAYATTILAVAVTVSEYVATMRAHLGDPKAIDRLRGTLEGLGIGSTVTKILGSVLIGAVGAIGARAFLSYLYKAAESAVNKAERAKLNSQEQAQVEQLDRELAELQRSLHRVAR